MLANNAVTMMSGSREITPLDISIADIRCQLKDFLLTDRLSNQTSHQALFELEAGRM